jgi:hypothetical protein
MHNFPRGVLPLAVTFFCGSCAAMSGSQVLAGQPAALASEGYVDAGDGVRLYYRTVGTGRESALEPSPIASTSNACA